MVPKAKLTLPPLPQAGGPFRPGDQFQRLGVLAGLLVQGREFHAQVVTLADQRPRSAIRVPVSWATRLIASKTRRASNHNGHVASASRRRDTKASENPGELSERSIGHWLSILTHPLGSAGLQRSSRSPGAGRLCHVGLALPDEVAVVVVEIFEVLLRYLMPRRTEHCCARHIPLGL